MAETWADLSDSGGYAHIIHNADDGSAWAADGYTLGGKEYFGGRSYVQMNGTRTLDGPYTIQEVLDFDRDRANRINVSWPGLMGTTDFKGATTAGVTWKDFTYVPGTRTFTFGSGNGGGSGYADRYLTGTIKGVRFYNRALTDAELARNRAADEIRFFGRAPAATGELVVASDVKGLIGNQPCGMYRPAGAYTFTAPAEAWLDGTPYECSGYTLETWDGSAWGSPVVYDGILAVAPDLSTASRRLTWNWRVKSRLTRVRSDYDVDDYVQTDLYLHLDGIRNAGATADHDAAATTWADLANGNDATFDFANAGVTGDGWTDNGYRFVYGGKFAGLPETLNFGSVVTIQAVCDVGKSGKTCLRRGQVREDVGQLLADAVRRDERLLQRLHGRREREYDCLQDFQQPGPGQGREQRHHHLHRRTPANVRHVDGQVHDGHLVRRQVHGLPGRGPRSGKMVGHLAVQLGGGHRAAVLRGRRVLPGERGRDEQPPPDGHDPRPARVQAGALQRGAGAQPHRGRGAVLRQSAHVERAGGARQVRRLRRGRRPLSGGGHVHLHGGGRRGGRQDAPRDGLQA